MLAVPPASAAVDLTPREILASGDSIAGLGRVGFPSLVVHGIDDAGRILVSGASSAGGDALVWAGDDGIEALWTSGAGPRLWMDRLPFAPNGRVVATNGDDLALYAVGPGTTERIAGEGDRTVEGARLCVLEPQFAVNDAGTVALMAQISFSGDGCDPLERALLLAEAGRLRIAATDGRDGGEAGLESWRLLGVARDGAIAVDGGNRILALRDGHWAALVEPGRDAGDGTLNGIVGHAMSPNGEVLFTADHDTDSAAYRTAGEQVLKVVSTGDGLPGGLIVQGLYGLDGVGGRMALNDAGAAALEARWFALQDGVASPAVAGVLAVAPDGSRRVVALRALLRGINAAGAVGLHVDPVHIVRPPLASAAARWRDGAQEDLLTPLDTLPGGGALLAAGIEERPCLGADGRVATGAWGADNRHALLCADANGVGPIARAGDPAPEGGVLAFFLQCVLPSEHDVVFLAIRRDRLNSFGGALGLYRGTPDGIELLLGSGQTTRGGESVVGLLQTEGQAAFAVNERSVVAAMAVVDDGSGPRRAVLRRAPGAPIDVIALTPAEAVVGRPEIGIAADDTVVAIVARDDDAALMAADTAQARTLVSTATLRDEHGVDGRIDALAVRGTRVSFAVRRADDTQAWFVYHLDGGAVERLSVPETASAELPRLLGFTAAGRMLFESVDPAVPTAVGTFLLDTDTPELIFRRTLPSDLAPYTLNDAGNILWSARWEPLGSERHSLSLSGPAPSAACFVPPTGVPQPPPTPQPTPRLDCIDGEPCVVIAVGTATGQPGDRAGVAAHLDDGGFPVAGVQVDLVLPTVVAPVLGENERPCRVNPEIDKNGTAFATLHPNLCPPNATCVRALVLALDNVDPIPNGARLFDCELDIAADAVPGVYAIATQLPGASNPDGYALPVRADAGSVEVLAENTDPVGPAPAAVATGGGCQVGGAPGATGLIPFLAAIVVAAGRAFRSRRKALSLLGCAAMTFAGLAGAAEHEILATGDVVAGFGRIGVAGFQVYGIDDRGRLLAGGQVHTGRYALVWADDSGITELWSGAPDGEVADAVRNGFVVPSGGGAAAAAGYRSLYRLEPGAVHALRHGDALADGARLCSVHQVAINHDGAVAVSAFAAPDVAACEEQATLSTWVVDGDGVRRVADALSLDAPYWDLLGIARDGTVVVSDASRRILALRDGALQVLAADGDRADSGWPLVGIGGAGGISPDGEVVFFAREDTIPYDGRFFLYRTDDGRIRRVDDVPIGSLRRLEMHGVAAMNSAGDVVVDADWFEDYNPDGTGTRQASGVVVFASDGSGRVAAREANGRGINESGAVGLREYGAGVRATRWTDGNAQPLLTALDNLPGGGSFAVGGIEWPGSSGPSCLADDGRAGAVVIGADYGSAVACGDARGFHAVARSGDPAPEGSTFSSFHQCAIPDGAQVLFAATRGVPDQSTTDVNVYRGTPDGLERVAGPGQRTDRGGVVRRLLPVGPTLFAVNAGGTALVRAETDRGEVLVRRRPGGQLEEVGFDIGGALVDSVAVPYAGIAGDASVIGTATIAGGALLASNGTDARILLADPDPRLPGLPLDVFGEPFVRGQRVALVAVGDDASWHLLLYDLADDRVRELLGTPPVEEPPWFILDATAAGRVLIEVPVPPNFDNDIFVVDDTGQHLLFRRSAPSDSRPLSINDRGNVLSFAYEAPGGIQRYSLSRSGPAPARTDCFVPPTAVLQPLPTPTPTTPPANCEDEANAARCARLRIGSTSGRPGERVAVAVSLQVGPPVSAIQNDLAIVGVAPIAGTNGRPACRVNPDIDKPSTSFAFQPALCAPHATCIGIRAIVISFANSDPIASGSVLYECDLDIAPDAAPGRYELTPSYFLASSPEGALVPSFAAPGAIEVLGGGNAPAAQQGASGNGCQVAAIAGASAWPLLAMPVFALISRRRTSP